MDILSPNQRSHRMSLVKSKGTKLEQSVQRIIKSLSFKCRLHLKAIPGRPDFVFPDRKKVIFVHGCFWHQHGRCRKDGRPRVPKSRLEYWGKKLIANRKRDVLVQKKLKKMGWKYLVLWECQIKKKTALSKLSSRIEKFIG